jgi:hypothetical protein
VIAGKESFQYQFQDQHVGMRLGRIWSKQSTDSSTNGSTPS